MRCVGIDRSFYRPLTEAQYAHYADQVPDDFRFVVKAPALLTDSMVRGEQGQGRQPNTAFLDPGLATRKLKGTVRCQKKEAPFGAVWE